MPKKNPDAQEVLKQLVSEAKRYATHMMETAGSVPPTLLALTPEGFLLFSPKALKDEHGKDQFANAGRLLAIGYKALGVAMILESWATFAKRPGLPLPNIPPSQSPDREEVVMIVAETRDAQEHQILIIQRNSSGKFTGFGTSLLPQSDKIEGRFAQMMPPNEPSEENAKTARQLLQTMGVVMDEQGGNPLWN